MTHWIGGNASAEAPDEAATGDTEVRTEVDIVVRGRLVETGFGKKKDYQGAYQGIIYFC